MIFSANMTIKITIANAFQSILSNSKRNPNKIWTDKGSEFYNTDFKKWLKDNNIEMYSTLLKVIAESFSRTLKFKIYKHLTAISENLYFNVLNDIVDGYYNTYHITNKMIPIDVKNDYFAEYNEEPNEKDPKFKVSDHVRISKYKNISVKGYAPNWSEEIFVIKKIKNAVPRTYVINDLNGAEILGSFYEKELQKTNQN